MASYGDYLPALRFQPTLAVSPDGRQVAYVNDAVGRGNAVVRPLAGGRPRQITTYADATVTTVAWSPDGESLLVEVTPAGGEAHRLALVSIDGGESEVVADQPGVRHRLGLWDPFSPTGRQLAYSADDRSPGDRDVLVRDLDTGAVRRVYTGDGDAYPGAWSPDGQWLTVVEHRPERAATVISLVAADGGVVKRLTPEGCAATTWPGPWLPDGAGFLVRSTAGRDFVGLGVMDAVTGELSWLATPEADVTHAAVAGAGRTLVWLTNLDGVSRLAARDLVTGRDRQLPALPAGTVSGLAATPGGRFAVVLLATPTRPANLMVIDLEGRNLRWLTNVRPARAEPARFVAPRRIRYPSRYGFEMPGYLYRPRWTRPVGAVLAIHDGPGRQAEPGYAYDGFFQYLAAAGLAVLAPNIRGSAGYGLSYQRAIERDWGGVDLADLADAAGYLRRQDWIDSDRIGLLGRSYGGFAALSCVARLPELNWAAAVSWSGPSDLVAFARSQLPGRRSQVLAMFGDPAEVGPFLRSRSPITHVDQIRTPLFVIQGASDPYVPRQVTDQLVKRLLARRVTVRYDVYHDEGHQFTNPENERSAWSAAGEFLLAHLRPRP
ncbi:MAG TPA: prolyl oligopeptidase family serine peptidase [Natronosporangium sp.]